MHPKGQFCGGTAKCGLWRECSVGGDVFSLRESRSAQQKGQPVCSFIRNDFFWNVHQEFSHFLWFQIYDESNILQDGTLIDLCGATLLWRSSEGLQHSPVIIIDFMPYAISFLMHFSAFDFVFCRQNVIWKS